MSQTPTYDEKEMALLIAEGNEEAFAKLYRQYLPQMVPFVSSIVKSEAIVDEIIQESFLRLWIGRDKLVEVENPKAWLFRITANICYSHLRRTIKEREILERIGPDVPVQEDEVQEMAQASEMANLVRKAIDELTPQRKKIYKLSRENGMTIPQIAAHLDLSHNTVKNTLVSSLQSIREFLGQHGYEVPVVILSLIFF